MRILIAEDSIVSRHLLALSLRSWGYDVAVAADGDQAWETLQQEDAPQLAVLDWMMPGLTGPEVCRHIRARESKTYTYVLLLTSRSLKEDLIEGMEAGADDYLIKPFDHHELKVRLRAGVRILELQAELLKAKEELHEQATKDGLTKIWNRHSILEILERNLERGAREHQPVGVAVVDLDHFKSINDTYGHQAGDAVLREAASRLKGSVRKYDDVGRYGGEEFLVVLPGCGDNELLAQAERMRQRLAETPVAAGSGKTVEVTGSFGLATATPGSGPPATAEELIHAADEALYAAKRGGRNRVVAAAGAAVLV